MTALGGNLLTSLSIALGYPLTVEQDHIVMSGDIGDRKVTAVVATW